ncbi:MAG: signal peptidase II [Bacteroidetes bacterium]|nr:signal peptidase II [Bacteroidota bacterium]
MRVLYVTLAIVVSDQITKLLVKGFSLPFIDFYHQGMQLGQSIPVIGDFLRITFIENPGMAFGIEIGGRLFLALFTFIASIGIFVYLYKVRNEALVIRLTLAVILGGAIGNLIDRCFYGVIFGYAPLFYGKVVDFIDMDFFKIDFLGFYMDRFAVFNIADASVSTGIALILLFYKKFTDLDKSAAAVKEETVQYAAGEEKSDV